MGTERNKCEEPHIALWLSGASACQHNPTSPPSPPGNDSDDDITKAFPRYFTLPVLQCIARLLKNTV